MSSKAQHGDSTSRSRLCRLNRPAAIVAAFFLLYAPGAAIAEETKTQAADAKQLNDSNNPLHPSISLNLHDYFIPSLGGPSNRSANVFLPRALVPMMVFDTPNLMRVTLPVVTEPTLDGGSTTGLGDLVAFDVAVFEQRGWAFGVGPVLGVPTASADRFGSGKWTAGAAGAFVVPGDWGLIGGLATYQKAFAGDSSRPDVQQMDFQPFIFYNLSNNFYLQSTAPWYFNLNEARWFIPVGLGIGKMFHLTSDLRVNAFLEPQYTVASGGYAPEWRIFAGFTFSYSLDKFLKKHKP